MNTDSSARLTSAGQSSTSGPQPQPSTTIPTQEPLFPPGLGFSPLFRAASCEAIDFRRGTVTGHEIELSLLDDSEGFMGLGLYGPNVMTILAPAHNTRMPPAVYSDMPWPLIAEPVLHWPPQVARYEERPAQSGPQFSMSNDLDLWVKNLKSVSLERASLSAGISCMLCRDKASADGIACEVEPVDPAEFMDFSFLYREDDYPPIPTQPPTPSVEEAGSGPRPRGKSESASPDNDSASVCSSEPRAASPANLENCLCPMKDRWFRADLTSEDVLELWCEWHVRTWDIPGIPDVY